MRQFLQSEDRSLNPFFTGRDDLRDYIIKS